MLATRGHISISIILNLFKNMKKILSLALALSLSYSAFAAKCTVSARGVSATVDCGSCSVSQAGGEACETVKMLLNMQ